MTHSRVLSLVLAVSGLLALHAAEPGDLDPTFKSGFTPTPGRGVAALVQDGSGRWLVSDGRTVARLHPDGGRDTGFTANDEAAGEIHALGAGNNGLVYVGGDFTSLGSHPSPHLARMTSDGRVDESWRTTSVLPLGSRANVRSIAVDTAGGLLVGGDFAAWNGVDAPSVVRLNADGSVITNFTRNLRPAFGGATNTTVTTTNINGSLVTVTNVTVSYEVLSHYGTMDEVGLLADGGALISGVVLSRLDSTGVPLASREVGFATWTTVGNGELLLAETFGRFSPALRMRLQRLRVGSAGWETIEQRDFTVDGAVLALRTDSAGRVLLAGDFQTVDGYRSEGLIRLNSDGTVDRSFVSLLGLSSTNASWEVPTVWRPRVEVLGLVVDAQDDLVVHGRFDRVDGQAVPGAVRIKGGARTSPLVEFGRGQQQVVAKEGERVRLGVPLASSSPVSLGWYRSGQPVAGATNGVLEFAPVRLRDSGEYELRATNATSTAVAGPFRLEVHLGPTRPGSIDGGFASDIAWNEKTATAGVITSLTPVGEHVYAQGMFTHFGEHPSPLVARLDLRGTVDTSFRFLRGNPLVDEVERMGPLVPLDDGTVATVIQWSGDVWMAGGPHYELIRLLPDGRRDDGFRGGPLNGRVNTLTTLAPGPNGTLLVATAPVVADPPGITNFFRLLPSGEFDPAFRNQVNTNGGVVALLRLREDRWLMGQVDHSKSEATLRAIDQNGGEVPDFQVESQDWERFRALEVDVRGRILVAPVLVAGSRQPALLRLLANGRVDESFRFSPREEWPERLGIGWVVPLPDNSMIVHVTSLVPVETDLELPLLARVLEDGSIDPGFEFEAEPLSIVARLPMAVTEGGWIWLASALEGRIWRLNLQDERRLHHPRWEGGRFQAEVLTKLGRRYSIESSTDLSQPAWREVSSFEGTDRPMRITADPGDGQFFRVKFQ